MRTCENGTCANKANFRMKETIAPASNHNAAYCAKCAEELKIETNNPDKVVKLIEV